MADLIFKDLSYKLNGIAYKIDNSIGFGLSEKTYSDAFEELLNQSKLNYEREVYAPIKIGDKIISKRYFDFLIEGKIIIEIKQGYYKYRETYSQLLGYLKIKNLKLGLIIRFTKNGVQIKRVPNFSE